MKSNLLKKPLFIQMNLQIFTKISNALVQKGWSKELMTYALSEMYMSTLIATGNTAVIQKIENLKKEAGDSITVPLRKKLTGDGVMDDADVVGNEEAMEFTDYTVTVHEYAHATKLKGTLEEQKTAINLRGEAKVALGDWMAEKWDKLCINALTANPTANRLIFAGGKTATNQLTDADKMTVDLISLARRKAKIGSYKIRPVKVKGKEWYILLMHDWQFRDMKSADDRWYNAQKDANIRGEDNPIFSGAEGVWDGCIIKTWENVHVKPEGQTGANVAKSLLLGAQAGVIAVAQETAWREDTFNYKKSVGFETDCIIGVGKPVFTLDGIATDFGCMQIQTGAKGE